MGEYIAKHTTAEWLKRLDAADVPCAPILRRGEIIHNDGRPMAAYAGLARAAAAIAR